MPAEVLVMCSECGRPQYATQESCVACGAKLPPAPQPRSPPTGRDAILEAFQPFLEANLGRGQLLSLSKKRLEWRPGAESKPILFELAALASVQLAQRPVYETLIFAIPALALAFLVGSTVIRVALAAFFVLCVVACLTQRRYELRLRNQHGEHARLYLGTSRPRAGQGARIESVWDALSQELRDLGVSVEKDA